MRAIVKIHTGGQAKRELAYCLDPDAKSKRDKLDSELVSESSERVGAVYGYGVKQSALEARYVDAVVKDLEERPSQLRRSGKSTRHVIISVDPDSVTKDDDVENSLFEASMDFLDSFCPGSKAVVVRHADSRCPHVHLIVENYDLSLVEIGHSPKRLDWQPSEVSEMQGFEWTKFFEKGRGSNKRKRKGQSEHWKNVTGAKAKGSSKRVLAMLKMKNLLTDSNVKADEEALILFFEGLGGYKLKTKTKRGNPLDKPSITIDEVPIRFSTFLEWATKQKEYEADDSPTDDDTPASL